MLTEFVNSWDSRVNLGSRFASAGLGLAVRRSIADGLSTSGGMIYWGTLEVVLMHRSTWAMISTNNLTPG